MKKWGKWDENEPLSWECVGMEMGISSWKWEVLGTLKCHSRTFSS